MLKSQAQHRLAHVMLCHEMQSCPCCKRRKRLFSFSVRVSFILAIKYFSKVKITLSLPVPAVSECQMGHGCSVFLSTVLGAKRCLKFLETNF